MKKFFITMLISLISIFSYANSDKVIDFYVNTETGKLMSNQHGVDVEQIDGTIANYTITIEKLIFSKYHCQCIIRIYANGSHPWDKFFIYRLRFKDATDKNDKVDVEQHAKEDTIWSKYKIEDTYLWFQDTFEKSWIIGYDLCYKVRDSRNVHYLYIIIHNALGHSIVTNVEEIVKDNQSTIYYDLQGHSSNYPFKGINIVKNNGTYEKRILKY